MLLIQIFGRCGDEEMKLVKGDFAVEFDIDQEPNDDGNLKYTDWDGDELTIYVSELLEDYDDVDVVVSEIPVDAENFVGKRTFKTENEDDAEEKPDEGDGD